MAGPRRGDRPTAPGRPAPGFGAAPGGLRQRQRGWRRHRRRRRRRSSPRPLPLYRRVWGPCALRPSPPPFPSRGRDAMPHATAWVPPHDARVPPVLCVRRRSLGAWRVCMCINPRSAWESRMQQCGGRTRSCWEGRPRKCSSFSWRRHQSSDSPYGQPSESARRLFRGEASRLSRRRVPVLPAGNLPAGGTAQGGRPPGGRAGALENIPPPNGRPPHKVPPVPALWAVSPPQRHRPV